MNKWNRGETDNQQRGNQPPQQERGQIIVILAVAMVGLLVAAGLAVDAGVLFMRKAQLDRAVDAAALAGVVELRGALAPGGGTNELPSAHARGMQLLAANGIVLTGAGDCPDPANPGTFWDTHEYCGEKQPGTVPGSVRYAVEVHWESEVYFMQLVGFDTIPLISQATAEYIPVVDIYASDTLQVGLLRTSSQSVFGPDICPDYGDPFSPTHTRTGSPNPAYSELYGAYTYRISIPPAFRSAYNKVRVELWDPDTYNSPTRSNITVYQLNGTSLVRSCSNSDRKDVCLLDTGDSSNPVWFVAGDENRGTGTVGACGQPSSYDPNRNTRTLFRLFYYRQRDDGTLEEVDLAYYIGESDGTDPTEAAATDMHWVSPGAPASERMPAFDGSQRNCVFAELAALPGSTFSVPPTDLCIDTGEPVTTVENCESYRAAHYGPPESGGYTQATECTGDGNFIVDLATEAPDIYEDPNTGLAQLFLQVRALSGASENGFDLWAGPARSEAGSGVEAPSDVNARQVYLLGARSLDLDFHNSQGVGVFGLGHLPMNAIADYEVDIPLTYLGPEFAGQQMTIEVYDQDAGALDPILFYFDTIPISDWSACYDDNGDGYGTCQSVYGVSRRGPADIPNSSRWQNPPYIFTVPSESATDPQDRAPFYGGRLIARYRPGTNDTYGWRMTLESRPFLVH